MRKVIWMMSLAVILSSTNLFGQKVFTKSGEISFISETPIESFTAVNNKAIGILDLDKGTFESAALIRSFIFERALMQEHFNENYMESTKFPKAVLKGNMGGVENMTNLEDGEYKITADGSMNIHGVVNKVSFPLTLSVSDGNHRVHGSFSLSPEDYDIKIPGVVSEQISKEMKISIDYKLEPLKK